MQFEHIENVNAYNCLFASVATLANYYGRDYHMISGGDWKLRYDVSIDNKRICEKMDIVSEVDVAYRTMEFHGFTWRFEKFEESYVNINTGCVKEFTYPFLISIDLYHSKWSKFYHRFHFLHYLIVCDYNLKKGIYFCVDPYYQYTCYKISKEDLYFSMNKFGRITFSELPSKSVDDYTKVIWEDILLVDKDNENYTSINRLADDISTKMDIHYEFDEFRNDLYAVPILDKFRKVAMCRDAYTCMLDYVYGLFEVKYLSEASNLIKQSVDLWRAVQGKLLKTYLTDSINSERKIISQMIRKTADIEKQAVEIILFNK